jgi:hypothetical protein
MESGGVGFAAKRKKCYMKHLNKTLVIAALVAVFGLANSASAQNSAGYRPTGDDGITASPKLRQFLNEHRTVSSTPSTTVASVGYRATGDDGITASPKLRQQLAERRTVASTPSTAVAAVGYRPTGDDGITASPKLRQQLNERGGNQFMIAPVK